MAGATVSAFTVYQEQYISGQVERLAQNLNIFNGASRNALQLRNRNIKGHYEQSTFYSWTQDLINRRDITSLTGVESIGLGDAELTAVKLNRRVGPIDVTLDTWKKLGRSQEERSFILGQQVADAKMKDYVELMLSALVASLEEVGSGVVYDQTAESTKTLIPIALNNGLRKFGDQASRVLVWVMHSHPFFDLVGDAITSEVTGLANVVLYGGGPGTLGRPVIVTDSPSLIEDGGSGGNDVYKTLGLVAGAATLIESETETMVSEIVTGLANLVGRTQGEYAVNLGLKGLAWNTGDGGGVNPTDAAIATGSNWEQKVADIKDLPGIVIHTEVSQG